MSTLTPEIPFRSASPLSSEISLDSLVTREPGLWIERNLKIQPIGGGPLVPFRLNSIQRILYRVIRACWVKAKPVRLWIPKYRRGGVSSLIQGLIFERTRNNPNRSAAVVAHDDEGAANIFRMTRLFQENLPEQIRESPPMRYSGRATMEWDKPHNSRYVVHTIKTGDALGKSFGYNDVHGSEGASWSDRGNDAKAAWVSIMNCVPRTVADTMVVVESTGNGRDKFFYVGVRRALQPSYRGNWQVVFLPWYLDENFRLPVTSSWTATEEEKHLVCVVFEKSGYRISNEQLEWRRGVMEDECGGEPAYFRRYYPTVLADCFELTESRFFPLAAIEHYDRHARAPKITGNMGGVFGVTKPEIIPDEAGVIQVWEKPKIGENYVVASDHAEGGPQGDFDHAYVLARGASSIVAALHGNFDSDDLANMLALLGQMYNYALLVPENNTRNDVVRRIWHELKYPKLYWDRDLAKAHKSRMYRPGWNTNDKSRSIMLDALRNTVRRKHLVCYDSEFAQEMRDFTWNETRKRFMAQLGRHDDRIVCAAIGVVVAELDQRPKSAAKVSFLKPLIDLFARDDARRKRRNEEDRDAKRFARMGSRLERGSTLG